MSRIAQGSFEGCTKLQVLENLKTIRIIDNNAFAHRTSLKTVDFSNVERIRNSVFEGYISLKNIIIKIVEQLGKIVLSHAQI